MQRSYLLFLRYFQLVALVVVIFFFLYLKLLKKKMKSSLRKLLLFLMFEFYMWGMVQLIGGYDTFLFIAYRPWEHPLVMVFWVLHLAGVWALCAWIALGGREDQAPQDEIGDSDYQRKEKRLEMLRGAIYLSIIPAFFILEFVIEFFKHGGVRSLLEGLNSLWP